MAKFHILIQKLDSGEVSISPLYTTLVSLYDHQGDEFSSYIGYATASRKDNWERLAIYSGPSITRGPFTIVRFEGAIVAPNRKYGNTNTQLDDDEIDFSKSGKWPDEK